MVCLLLGGVKNKGLPFISKTEGGREGGRRGRDEREMRERWERARRKYRIEEEMPGKR